MLANTRGQICNKCSVLKISNAERSMGDSKLSMLALGDDIQKGLCNFWLNIQEYLEGEREIEVLSMYGYLEAITEVLCSNLAMLLSQQTKESTREKHPVSRGCGNERKKTLIGCQSDDKGCSERDILRAHKYFHFINTYDGKKLPVLSLFH